MSIPRSTLGAGLENKPAWFVRIAAFLLVPVALVIVPLEILWQNRVDMATNLRLLFDAIMNGVDEGR